ncbi:MAG: DUF3352 domain-containing protein [bacterium]|nr:DUF3352 domain-containing protein [bacterium]
MKKFLIAIAVILLAVAAYMAWIKYSPDKFSDGFYLIPNDAIMVIETEDPINSWKTFSTSNLWLGLKTFPAFAEITKNADLMDDVIEKNQQIFSLIGQRHLLISVHMTKAKDYDFVYYADMAQASKSDMVKSSLLSLVGNFGYQRTVRSYMNTEVNEFFDKASRETLSIAFVNNYLVCTYNKALIDRVISASQLPESQLGTNTKFTEANQLTTADGLCRILINYNKFHEYMGVYMEDVSNLKELFTSLHYTGFDCTLKDDLLMADGYTIVNDSVSSYIQALSISGKSENNSASIFSGKSSFYLSMGFKSFNDFYANLNTIWKKDEVAYAAQMQSIRKVEKMIGINLQKNLFDWMGNEIGLAQYETDNLIGNKVSNIMAIKARNIEDAKTNLAYIEKQVRKRTPLKFKDIDYKGYPIKYMEVKGLFKSFLGKLFSKFDKPYYTILGDFVVMSDDPRTLLMTVDDFIKQNTLANNENYRDFREHFPNETSLFTYLSPDRHFANFKGYLNPESWKSTQKNQQYVRSFSHVALSLSGDNDRMRSVLGTFYKAYVPPVLSTEDTASTSDQDTLSELDLFLINHFQNNMNTVYFDNGRAHTVTEMDGVIADGAFMEYFENGVIKVKGRYSKGLKSGTWKYYNSDGSYQNKEKYENGEIKRQSLLERIFGNGD